MKWTMMSWAKLLLLVVAVIMTSRSVLAQSAPDSAQDNVLTFHGSPDRKGNFIVPGLTWQRAKSLHMDEKFHARVAGNVYAQPLHWRAAGSSSGMLLVATEGNNVHALDATTGNAIWTRSLGKPVAARPFDAETSVRSELPAPR
jgi:hypothetical protein